MRAGAIGRSQAGARIGHIRRILSRARVELAYRAVKSPAVPDISRTVRGNQMRSKAANPVFFDLDGSRLGRCKAAYLVYSRCIFAKPDRSLWSDSHAIWIAARRRNRSLYHLVCIRVQKTDIVRAKFREPEISSRIENQVKRRTAFL